jgi:type I restriction enzyme S subunit
MTKLSNTDMNGQPNWRNAPLSDVADIIMGQSPPSETYNRSGDGLPFLQGAAEFGPKYPTPKLHCNAPAKIAEAGDILISVRAPVGEINFAKERCCIGRGLAAVRTHDPRSREFLFYALNYHKAGLTRVAAGSTFAAVRVSDVEEMVLEWPINATEQYEISEILFTADEAVQKTDEAVAELEQLKKGLMQRLLTRGLGHNKFKNTELGQIPQSRTVIALGDLLQEVRYGTSRKANTSGQGYPVIGTPNVLGGELNVDVIRHVELPESERKNLTLQEGDILLVRTNANPRYIGRCAMFPVMEGAWVYASYLIRIRPDPKQIIPLFLVKFLQSRYVRKRFEEMAKTSAGNHNINTQEIRSIKVAVPPLPEQQNIAAVLSELDAKIFMERRRRKEQAALKNGLMQKLLTGKLRVKV